MTWFALGAACAALPIAACCAVLACALAARATKAEWDRLPAPRRGSEWS